MAKPRGLLPVIALLAGGAVLEMQAAAQTPEQQQRWDAERGLVAAAEKTKNEELLRARASRKADPMGWVRSLDPMAAGGWEFRGVANDGSWAAYTTNHQMKRSGKIVTVWLRQEYAEPQVLADSRYLSVVAKTEYDCAKQQARPLVLVYYSNNNVQGSEQTLEADKKTAVWNPIVPGTREDVNFLWACGSDTPSSRR